MADQWLYQADGRDIGPVSFSELQDLAASGRVTPDSEVRSISSFSWQRASHVKGLNFEPADGASNVALPKSNGDIETTAGQMDQWYCRVGGLDLGPLTFDELLDLAKTQQISVDDDVRFGAEGKWRRVGSIGRLMAALPYQSPAVVAPRPVKRPPKVDDRDPATLEAVSLLDSLLSQPSTTPLSPSPSPSSRASSLAQETPEAVLAAPVDSPAAYQLAFQQATAAISAQILSQAEEAFRVAESAANADVAWALGPNADPKWWGWAGSVEFGPVEFTQVLALARNGQLRPTDFVRNGEFGQFVPSANVPGLFSAVAKIAKAVEALTLAQAQAKAASAVAIPELPPDASIIASRRTLPTPSREISVPRTEFAEPDFDPRNDDSSQPRSSNPRPMDPPMRTATNRPLPSPVAAVAVRPPVPKKTVARSSGPGLIDRLKETLTGEYGVHFIGVAAAVLFLGYWYYPRGPVHPVAVHPVKGRVLIDGEPLANAVIALHVAGSSKTKSKLPKHTHPRGRAAQDGTFALETFDRADGAPEGEFVATVFLVEEKVDADGDKVYGPNLLPPIYGKPESSPLKLKITASTKELEPLMLSRK